MTAITELLNLDASVVLSFFVIVFALVAAFDAIGKLSVYIGKPVKWVKKNNEDHESIVKLAETLDALKKQQDTDREQSIIHDERIRNEVDKFAAMFFEKNIEDMRWRILDFASAISNGRKFNRESYDFIIKTYDQYEKILKEQGRTNGVVDATVLYIREEYMKHLRNGDFK